MKTLKLLPVLALSLTVGSVALLVPATASADERACRGKIGKKSVDDLRVPRGASCVLTGTRVDGNIKVGRNAVLRARNVRVGGNVQGENSRLVNVVRGSRVGGDVQVFSGRSANVRASIIGGNVQYDENRGVLRVINNRVDGDVQLFKNRGTTARKVQGNRIEGNLQCKENRPAPTGGGNKVGGNKEDQCARL